MKFLLHLVSTKNIHKLRRLYSQLLQFPFKRFIEDGWQQSIQFSGGFCLQALEGVYFDLEFVEIGDDATLFGEGGKKKDKPA